MAKITASVIWNKVFTRKHLRRLFYERVKNSGAVGLDWITADHFEKELDSQIEIIIKKCNAGTYSFTRYREILLSKGAGKPPRRISIPTIRDKLVFTALNEVLVGVYGYSMNTQMPQVIVNKLTRAMRCQLYSTFIKADIKTFYASINHEILYKKLHKRIRKEAILKTIMRALRTNSGQPNALGADEGNTVGIPEGLPISNILANIYMFSLDEKFSKIPNCLFCRYVDDILILTDASWADFVNSELNSEIHALGLALNEEKTVSSDTKDGFDYLGYTISAASVSVRQNSIIKFERTIETIFRDYCRLEKKNKEYLQWKINLKVTGFVLDGHKYGWMFFYSQITDLSLLAHLDWLIIQLKRRFSIGEIDFKSFVRTYHEITKALHTTHYVPNFDHMTIEEKRHIVQNIYNQNVRDNDDDFVNMRFKKIMSREIRDVQKDVQPFS